MQKNTRPEVSPSLAMRPERLLTAGTNWDENIAIARSEAARQYIILRNRRVYDYASLEELRQHANLAMVVATRKGLSGPALRLDVRHSLRDFCDRGRCRCNHSAPMLTGDVFNADWNKANTDPRQCLISKAITDAKLSDRQRLAVQLVYFDGLTERDAAAKMGCTQQAVNKHLTSAVAHLKKIFPTTGC